MNHQNNGINKNTIDLIKSQKIDYYYDSSIIEFLENFSINKNSDKRIKRVKNNYICEYKYRTIEFGLLSDYVNEDSMKNNLFTYNRYGKCHYGSLWLLNQDNFLDAYLVCGYIYSKNEKYFHNVIIKNNIVYDYTKNLILHEDDYYHLTNFEILNILTYEQVQKSNFYLFVPLGIYFMFNKEIDSEFAKKKIR